VRPSGARCDMTALFVRVCQAGGRTKISQACTSDWAISAAQIARGVNPFSLRSLESARFQHGRCSHALSASEVECISVREAKLFYRFERRQPRGSFPGVDAPRCRVIHSARESISRDEKSKGPSNWLWCGTITSGGVFGPPLSAANRFFSARFTVVGAASE